MMLSLRCNIFLLMSLTFALFELSDAQKCFSKELSSINWERASLTLGSTTNLDIELQVKYSSSACVKGESFGTSQDTVFVDSGCRGLFKICYEGEVECLSQRLSSINSQRFAMGMGSDTVVTSIDLEKQYSNAACVVGQSFGSIEDIVYVDEGCRGKFFICYKKNDKCLDL